MRAFCFKPRFAAAEMEHELTPEELLKQGKLEECLKATEAKVKAAPADAKLRVLLFQVLSVLGQWDRAANQVEVSAELDTMNNLLASMYKAAILCERMRAEVFAGNRTPLILGEPEAWMGMMVRAAQMNGQGQHAAAAELRAQAFELAPTTAGEIDVGPEEGKTTTHTFEWIADADERVGPMLEAIVNGKYYWVPWSRIKLLRLEAPTDLRDSVWLPGQVVWSAGGEQVVLVPARYPGSEAASRDVAIRLARRTEFVDQGGWEGPVGQRMFATDAGEFPLLEVRAVRTAGE